MLIARGERYGMYPQPIPTLIDVIRLDPFTNALLVVLGAVTLVRVVWPEFASVVRMVWRDSCRAYEAVRAFFRGAGA
jgi:hypothetical protein